MPESDLQPSAATERRLARLAVPALLVANLALACGPWLVRLAQTESHVGPIGSGFWRLAIAMPLLLLAGTRANEVRPPAWPRLFAVAFGSGLFFAADLAAWHIGILHTRLANATLFGNITAILFPAYGFLIARRWPSRRQAVAMGLALAGATLLLGRSYELAARNIVGDLSCILAGLCYTLYLVTVDRARGRLGPVTTLTMSMAAGIPALLLVAIGFGEQIRPDAWTPLVLLALGSQVIGQGLILFALSRVQPIVVGLMLLVQPIVAATIGWLVYGERLTPFDVVGGIGIAVAVLLVRDTGRPLRAPEKRLEALP